jgi:transcription-repair coupling factor (superfamily II helicase)
MEASFPYEETPDQARAVVEVKADMEVGRPMDRLVVGDVGYGKTEVACGRRSRRSRTASRSRSSSRRRSSPRSISRRSASGSRRSRPGPAAVAVRRAGRAEEDGRRPREGSVDLVIGTHRLLSKDVVFRDLGLVVVDEEQRFGVAAKERLKQLRREVDVLTLSATPIPRTLNLALAGVRDMSVIETPPEDRLPIQTRVAEASAGLVRDAILRELDRGGQVFFVHNRVETIEAQTEQLRRMLPAPGSSSATARCRRATSRA